MAEGLTVDRRENSSSNSAFSQLHSDLIIGTMKPPQSNIRLQPLPSTTQPQDSRSGIAFSTARAIGVEDGVPLLRAIRRQGVTRAGKVPSRRPHGRPLGKHDVFSVKRLKRMLALSRETIINAGVQYEVEKIVAHRFSRARGCRNRA
jgi:hypothetical protein